MSKRQNVEAVGVVPYEDEVRPTRLQTIVEKVRKKRSVAKKADALLLAMRQDESDMPIGPVEAVVSNYSAIATDLTADAIMAAAEELSGHIRDDKYAKQGTVYELSKAFR